MKRKFVPIISAAVIALMLTACGSKRTASFETAPNEAGGFGWAADYDMVEEADVAYEDFVEAPVAPVEDYVAAETAPAGAAKADIPENTERKIIKNGSMTIETVEYERFTTDLEATVDSFGGYIESSSQSGSESYSDRNGHYTIRVPYDKYDALVNTVGELGTVTRQDHSIDDVTLKYVDLEARLAALTAERDSFMALMERAETVEEILQIQSYLTDVNYQIESFTSQLNSLKNQVSYSTLEVYVNEVYRVTQAEPKTVWERISQNLDDNVYDIKEGFKDMFVGIVSSSPYLGIYAVIIVIIVIIAVAAVKASRKNRQKRIDEYNARYQQSHNEQQGSGNDKK